MRGRTITVLICLIAALLAWADPLLVLALPPVDAASLLNAGWSLTALRWLLRAIDILPGLALHLLGCWLLWRVARAKASSYSWLPVALAITSLIVVAARLSMWMLRPGPAHDIAYEVWYWNIPASGILGTGVAMLLLLEPYASAPLGENARKRAVIYAALASATTLMMPLPQSWTIANAVYDALYWPVYGLTLSFSGLIAAFGIPHSWVTLPIQVFAVCLGWYLVARTWVAWRASRPTACGSADTGGGAAPAVT